jgi:hypothetical protein
MMKAGIIRPGCVLLAFLIALPAGFAQTSLPLRPAYEYPGQADSIVATAAWPAPSSPQRAASQSAAPSATPSAAQRPAGSPLTIAVIEGNNAINSIPLLRSVMPVVEVRDENDFPVEGAALVFTLPAEGPGGRFVGDSLTLSTRSDAHGQASAPFIMNVVPGKFQIKVEATAGNRQGQSFITQTNTTGTYSGPRLETPHRSWTSRWYTWAIIGGVAAAVVTVVLVTHKSNSSSQTVTVTPGGPVFH